MNKMDTYEVFGTMTFNVSMIVNAESEDEAEEIAMDRMDEGTIDGFVIGESVGDNEVFDIKLVKQVND